MKMEYRLKTKPKYGFSHFSITCSGWTKIIVSQDVTNIGTNYSVIEKAKLVWKAKNGLYTQTTFTKDTAPTIISPSEKRTFEFEISDADLNKFKTDDILIPTSLITGDIIYQCRGLDNKEIVFVESVYFEQHCV